MFFSKENQSIVLKSFATAAALFFVLTSSGLAVEWNSCDDNASDAPYKLYDQCAAVGVMQAALKQLNLYNCSDKCQVDNKFGEKTQEAVTQFQKSHSLPETGEIDQATWDAVKAAVAEKKPEDPKKPSGGGNNSGKDFCDTKYFDFENGICIPKSNFGTDTLAGSTSFMDLITKVLKVLLLGSGVIAVVAIVWGGQLYLTSGGNEENSEKAKKVLINAFIGLVVVLLAYALVNIIVFELGKSAVK